MAREVHSGVPDSFGGPDGSSVPVPAIDDLLTMVEEGFILQPATGGRSRCFGPWSEGTTFQ